MTTRIKMMAACVLCVGLSVCAPLEEGPTEPPQREAGVCPADGYLNCMPIVPPQRRAFCTADYRTWITNNCPDVEIIY